ncbi:hypothetical protein L596_012937 [Steinernema carpocapsae]|uniref:Uncharacterized protein n=1 Tax=Steinernema carpocapsae TaxID=34508 RepID=A0A4U5NYK1_STECR|nr:hypothetical protein L596_012933 [Steinernema carpocapsae]TKR88739.1 hypothetical protein L596_012937 [Steinernema carpocapsae]
MSNSYFFRSPLARPPPGLLIPMSHSPPKMQIGDLFRLLPASSKHLRLSSTTRNVPLEFCSLFSHSNLQTPLLSARVFCDLESLLV